MNEILKQILGEIKTLKVGQDDLKANQMKTDLKIEGLVDRIDEYDKSNKVEFKQMNRKLDGITEVVAKTMEEITELKDKVERQDVEIRVLRGAKI